MKKERIVMIVAVIVLVAVIVIAVAVTLNNAGIGNKGKEEKTTSTEVLTFEEPETEGDAKSEESDYWNNVQVYEETVAKEMVTNKKGEAVTDKNGENVTVDKKEKVSEAYPGEAEGWSPIVSPDDLEDNEQ